MRQTLQGLLAVHGQRHLMAPTSQQGNGKLLIDHLVLDQQHLQPNLGESADTNRADARATRAVAQRRRGGHPKHHL